MKIHRIPIAAIAGIALALALALPIAALANVTGAPTLAAGTALSLDTGDTSASGGDLLWSGTSLTPQGNAAAIDITAITGQSGAASYDTYTQAALSAVGSLYSKSAIAASSLTLNTILAVKTNGAHYAKVLVTAVTGTSIRLRFDTFGASGGATVPTITQILNNYGLVPAGFSNSGIAPGSLFIIKGSGLADPNAQAVLESSASPGLPATLNGASVRVTVGGATTIPVFYYAIASQLALVLPSNTPVGNATLTVSYGGQTSSPASFQVVQSAMGFDAYYGTGSGLGVATNNATGALYNYTNAIPPGATVVLWGSGLGADPPRDTTYNPNVVSINSLAHVYIGGLDATIVYQGGSGYPGLNQVDVTIPAGVAPGCNVSLVGVNSAGVPTNFVSLPIGNGVCSDPSLGATGTELQNGSAQTTVKSGFLSLIQSTQPASSGGGTQTTGIADGIFHSVTGSSYGAGSGSVSIGGCVVTQSVGTGTGTTTTGLDAGSISVTGSSGTVALTEAGNTGIYAGQLASGFISLGGTYTFKGLGGTNVGPFSASVTFPNSPLVWTNTAAFATVTRASGATFNWTGGAGSYVIIAGSSTGTATGAFANYACLAPVAAGSFTVPAYVLSGLPAGAGSSTLANIASSGTFTATGIDYGTTLGEVVSSVSSTYN